MRFHCFVIRALSFLQFISIAFSIFYVMLPAHFHSSIVIVLLFVYMCIYVCFVSRWIYIYIFLFKKILLCMVFFNATVLYCVTSVILVNMRAFCASSFTMIPWDTEFEYFWIIYEWRWCWRWLWTKKKTTYKTGTYQRIYI